MTSDMSDVELYRNYERAKEDGGELWLEELESEIVERWQDVVERECEV